MAIRILTEIWIIFTSSLKHKEKYTHAEQTIYRYTVQIAKSKDDIYELEGSM